MLSSWAQPESTASRRSAGGPALPGRSGRRGDRRRLGSRLVSFLLESRQECLARPPSASPLAANRPHHVPQAMRESLAQDGLATLLDCLSDDVRDRLAADAGGL